jgi:hypothetical protein
VIEAHSFAAEIRTKGETMLKRLALIFAIAFAIAAMQTARAQQNPPAGTPITGGGQPISGPGVTQGQPDFTPDQMAVICNKRAKWEPKQTDLKDAVARDYAAIKWAGQDFQQKSSAMDAWGEHFSESEKEVIQHNVEGMLNISKAVVDLDEKDFLLEEIAWTKDMVVDAVTGQIDQAAFNHLTQMTEDQLKTLKAETEQLKNDTAALKGVNAQLEGVPQCDSTKLVVKEPAPPASSGSTPTPPPTAAPKSNHAGLIVGGVVVGGAAAAAALVLGKGVTSPSSSSGEVTGQCDGFEGANACQPCTCLPDASGGAGCVDSSECPDGSCFTQTPAPFC